MTLQRTANAVKKRTHVSPRTLGYCYMSLFIMILFFKNASVAALWVTEGLRLCATKLIPSLFPFMVVSALLIKSGAGAHVLGVFSKPFGALFGTGVDGSCALALGWLCGFPVGAKCACDLYASGRITKEEYKTILCISGTPSPAFLIGTVGGSMLGSKATGAFLYVTSILSSALIGIFLGRRQRKQGKTERVGRPTAQAQKPFFRALTESVSDSALSMLNVCAFVVFFSAFLGALEGAIAFLGSSGTLSSLTFSFFELTSGLARISASDIAHKTVLCAVAVGWSGLSVHFQTMSIGLSPNVSFTPYVLSHAVRTALCGVFGLAAEMILPRL